MTERRYPQSTEDKLYIPGESIDMDELFGAIFNHFGVDVQLEDFHVEQENIQIACFGYDLYDPVDWQQYFIITKKNT